MTKTIQPGPRTGTVSIPASKSRAHRLLICAALSGREITLRCQGISKDIEATMNCLRGMGYGVRLAEDRITVTPRGEAPTEPVLLRCGESGSTLRFLLPVVGALGLEGEFLMEGRLPQRPLQPLWDLLVAHGMRLSQEGDRLRFSGKLSPGEYEILGNISSQYISGLLFALPLLAEESILRVTGTIESADYIAMTEDALALFGVQPKRWKNTDEKAFSPLPEAEKKDTDVSLKYVIPGDGYMRADNTVPEILPVEADWSSASFFLTLGALSPNGVTVTGMDLQSRQGDKRILELLEGFGARVEAGEQAITVRRGDLSGQHIDASAIPDMVPILAVIASVSGGTTVIDHAERLRLKESDRLKAVSETLSILGAEIQETADGLVIQGKPVLRGGTVSSWNDHRIAMSAAVAASVCEQPVTIEGAECTEKSFPGFWELLEGMSE